MMGRILTCCLILLLAAGLSSGDVRIDWWTIDGGSAMFLGGGDFELSGTLGQADAGPVLAGGAFELTGGFWQVRPADCTGDWGVDLADFGIFESCMTGPGGSLGVGCICADLDGDGDVDLADMKAFQAMFTGF